MSSENAPQKINLILCDLPQGITESELESFLSPYKKSIVSIHINEKNPQKANATFNDSEMANKCRKEMNQRKIKNNNIRIMREEKYFLQKNKETKNNLYVKNIPKEKDARELYEYFLQFGDVFSLKVNENEKMDFPKTAFLTYYKEEDAKKCIDNTTNKKIWGSDMEVQYQKNTNEKGYNNNHNNYHSNYNNYNNYSNRNLKINITNLPDNYTDKEISKLCEEFGKCEICDIKTNRYGKFAIVKFSKESEAKTALEKLNNKEIAQKKLVVKEPHYNNYNNNSQHYPNYNNYNKRPNNFPFFYNYPLPKIEEQYEKNNLYVSNIPPMATKEDLEKTFGQYGPIKNIKLDEDKSITSETKEKIKFLNRGFGYVLFEKQEDAQKALESLAGKYIIGFENYFKPLNVDNFIPKDKRNITQGTNYYNISNAPMIYPGQFIPAPQYMMPMPIGINPIPNNQLRPNQYMLPQGNFKGGFRRFNNNRGRIRGKNIQKRNNMNTNNNIMDKKEEEKKIVFDKESFDKMGSDEDKRDFLGEKLFNLIQENQMIKEKNEDNEIVGKITGMILGIENFEEIIDILESPSKLEGRIKEALELLEKNK
jgi:RNA recognition motif-containing protein